MSHRATCSECPWTGDAKTLNGAAREAGEHREETGHDAKVERDLMTDGGEVSHKFEECPTCGGDLQYQTRSDAECLNCGEVFCHEIRSDRHLLWNFDAFGWMNEVVARVE